MPHANALRRIEIHFARLNAVYWKYVALDSDVRLPAAEVLRKQIPRRQWLLSNYKA